MLLYVGRYGRQDAIAMSDRLTTPELVRWMKIVDAMLEREKPGK